MCSARWCGWSGKGTRPPVIYPPTVCVFIPPRFSLSRLSQHSVVRLLLSLASRPHVGYPGATLGLRVCVTRGRKKGKQVCCGSSRSSVVVRGFMNRARWEGGSELTRERERESVCVRTDERVRTPASVSAAGAAAPASRRWRRRRPHPHRHHHRCCSSRLPPPHHDCHRRPPLPLPPRPRWRCSPTQPSRA